jgi:phosphonate transport system substrate-binding protein
MNRKYILPLLLLIASIFLSDCSLPRVIAPPTATPTSSPIPLLTTDTPPALSTAQLGLVENPIILALSPSVNTPEQIAAARFLADQLTKRTGYAVVTVIPDSYTALVDALANGNAHIALLTPYAYTLAYQQGSVHAALATLQNGDDAYGAQFIATRDGGFKSFVDPITEKDTAEAKEALAQFTDKKPCWSDETSPSGYVIPAGYLQANNITTKPAAFVAGHPTVVRSLYAEGICDFGGTYIDARKFPSLEDEFPDLMEKVILVWRIPEVIPYDLFAFSTQMPQGMHNLFNDQILALMQTTEGFAAFQLVYGIEALRPENDAFYNEFRTYVEASGVDIHNLLDNP